MRWSWRSLLVGCLLLMFTLPSLSAPRKHEQWISPDKQYCLYQIPKYEFEEDGDFSNGEYTIAQWLVFSAKSMDCPVILGLAKYHEVNWSPDSKTFVVSEFSNTHTASLKVLSIEHEQNALTLKTLHVLDAANQRKEWTFKSWHPEQEAVIVQKVESEATSDRLSTASLSLSNNAVKSLRLETLP